VNKMRERKLFALMMLLALSALSFIPVRLASASPGPTISITPATITGAIPGTTFTVNVDIAGAADMYAWSVRVSFNKLLLSLENVVKGNFLEAPLITTFFVPTPFDDPTKTAANLNGYIDIACTRLGEVPGQNGGGTAATLTFMVLEVHNDPIGLSDAKWKDSALNDGTFDAQNSATFDNTGLVGTWMGADLAGHSAWPEHHHFVISKAADFDGTYGSMLLYGKVRSLGPTAPAYLRAHFQIVLDTLTPFDVYTDATTSRIDPGTILVLTAKFGPVSAADAGKYSVTATTEMSWGGTYWYPGMDVKTFSFAVVP